MNSNEAPQENLQLIRQQLVDATQELNNLKMRRGESFRDFEYRTKGSPSPPNCPPSNETYFCLLPSVEIRHSISFGESRSFCLPPNLN